jgi:hypothetical protein
MNAAIIAALAVAVPVILFPAALVWYINIGGIVEAVRNAKAARVKKTAKAVA